MKRLSLPILFLILLPASPASASDGYPRVSGVDVIHYRIALTIDATDSVITGETGLLISFTADGIPEIPLDFGALTVDRVTEQDAPVSFRHEGERLIVPLKSQYRKGDRITITVMYHGQPVDGLFIQRSKFGDRTVFADNWPNRARHWFPGIDHPYDKATAEFVVTAPDHYDVVANGRLLETIHLLDGRKRTRWRTQTEVPTYCMVVGATTFSIIHAGSWNGIPVTYYLYPEDRDNGITDFDRSLRMLEFYSSLIGPYPYAKLALVQSSTRFGGMENASAIFFSERSITGAKRNEGTVAHEIAHQWFGDSVTEADWHDLWLSEGFATYFGAVFFERADGRDRFLEMMQGSKARYLQSYAKDQGRIYDENITDLFKLLNAYNYSKGAWVLHMLRGVMGDTPFFDGIRDYYRIYRDRTASTEGLQRVMERHAGQPLDWFFRQWIYEAGHPVYNVEWTWNAGSRQAQVRIRQTQDGVVFRMPLTLAFRIDDQNVLKTVVSDRRDQTFTFSLDARPDRVMVDPDEWVLKEVTVTAGR